MQKTNVSYYFVDFFMSFLFFYEQIIFLYVLFSFIILVLVKKNLFVKNDDFEKMDLGVLDPSIV